MPSGSRRSRRAREPHPELDVDKVRLGGTHLEVRAGREWQVRTVSSPDKTYRCPGCQQTIAPKTTHVVAWESEGLFGAQVALAERRHWHSSCWRRA